MTPSKYLDQLKAKIGVESDYALAKTLEIPNGYVAEFRTGRRGLSPYLCTRIAIGLGIDPTHVIADIEEQREKNAKRKEFWRSLRRNTTAGASLAKRSIL